MRRTLMIGLIAIHLFGNTELGQLFKLPKLITHYFQHRETSPGISFFDFLAMHYGGDDGTSADNDIDNQLPYHQVDYHCLFGTYCSMADNIFEMSPFEYAVSTFGNRLATGIPSEYVSLLLRPPRAV